MRSRFAFVVRRQRDRRKRKIVDVSDCIHGHLVPDSVEERGRTVESYLSRTRDITAAKAFFRKALKRQGEPRTITLQGSEPRHAGLRRRSMNNEFNFRWEHPVKIRSCQYLNNMVEPDHRLIKSRLRPMLGFKSLYNARPVLLGIELLKKL